MLLGQSPLPDFGEGELNMKDLLLLYSSQVTTRLHYGYMTVT